MRKEIKTKILNSEIYSEDEILNGLLFLLREYYIGAFEINEKELHLAFDNGQCFVLSVKEV